LMPRSPITRPQGYDEFLRDLKQRIRTAQVKAVFAVNRELILLYWQIGRGILERQHEAGWGAKVIERLAADLHREFPGTTGFSRTNLLYMRAFAAAWPEEPFVQQVVGRIPWGHNLPVMGRVIEAKAAGHFSGAADLSIELVSVRLQGANGPQDVSVLTQPLSSKAQGRGTNTAEKTGGGAAVGAIIGGLAGGGAGAGIGALSGGVLGGGSNALSRGKEIVVKPEQLLPFRTSSPLEVTIVLVDGHQIVPADASGPQLQGRPLTSIQPQ
jgi:predicted nuclease of restriction endonuclease-like (RecB) superfamily